MLLQSFKQFSVASTILIGIVSTPSMAEESVSEIYSITKLDNGYIRLNSKTGQVSLCVEKSSRLVCVEADDERRTFDAKISALEERIETLETQMNLRSTAKRKPLAEKRSEMEDAMELGEFALRRFFDLAQELEDRAKK